MFSRAKKSKLAIVVSFALAFAPVFPAYADSCSQPLVDACRGMMEEVKGAQYNNAINYTGGNRNGINAKGNADTVASQAGYEAAGDCGNSAKQCEYKCKSQGQAAIDKCKQDVNQASQAMQAQAAADGASGSGNSNIAALMGAAGALAGMLLAMKKKKDDQPPPPPVFGALQPDGKLNCMMADSYRYLDCDGYLSRACMGFGLPNAAPMGTPTTGTIISVPGGIAASPDCGSFNARYCSPSASPPSAYGNALPNGAVTQVNIAGSGEGLGTPYCQTAVANAWCSDPAYGPARAGCPACLQAASSQSQACATNPALCLAQNSPGQMGQFQNNPACAGDPLISAGSPYATGGGTFAAVGGGSGPVPAVVLPQSAGGTTTNGAPNVAGTGGGTATGTSGGNAVPVNGHMVVTSSARVASQGAIRDGQGSGASASLGGSGAKAALKAGASSTSELVAAGGVIVAGAPRNVSRGPASDVEAQYGPSLFVTSTQVIRHFCQAGKLNNCP